MEPTIGMSAVASAEARSAAGGARSSASLLLEAMLGDESRREALIARALDQDRALTAEASAIFGGLGEPAALAAAIARTVMSMRDWNNALAAAKIAALKEFAYGAGHEINNPLANISARAQTLLRDETHPERRRTLATINRQAFRAHEMIADLMLFARPPELAHAPTDIAKIAERVVAELADEAAQQATLLTLAKQLSAEDLVTAVDATQLAVAVKAVVRNALEALAAGGSVQVSVRRVSMPTSSNAAADDATGERGALSDASINDSGSATFWRCLGRLSAANESPPESIIEILVADNGPGFSPREQAHLFDPYFSGREAGRGLGFGLCKAWRIVTDHGGQIAICSRAGAGATVTISLPDRS